MRSGGRELGNKRIGGHVGYSLLELLASAVLLVSIAVLALPTYKDFAPHDDRVERDSPASSLSKTNPAGALPAERPGQRQSMQHEASGADEESEYDSTEALADG